MWSLLLKIWFVNGTSLTARRKDVQQSKRCRHKDFNLLADIDRYFTVY